MSGLRLLFFKLRFVSCHTFAPTEGFARGRPFATLVATASQPSVVLHAAAWEAVAMGKPENQAELSSPSASVARIRSVIAWLQLHHGSSASKWDWWGCWAKMVGRWTRIGEAAHSVVGQ